MTKSELKDALELFASKPDDALESTEVGAAFLGCCQRTVRYHPKLERVYITPRKYNFRVGNLRAVAKGRHDRAISS